MLQCPTPNRGHPTPAVLRSAGAPTLASPEHRADQPAAASLVATGLTGSEPRSDRGSGTPSSNAAPIRSGQHCLVGGRGGPVGPSHPFAAASPNYWLRQQYQTRHATRELGPRWQRDNTIDRLLLKIVAPLVGTARAADRTRDQVTAILAGCLGPVIAPHVAVATVKRGCLVLRADHPLYIMEARGKLAALRAKLAPLNIADVRFTHHQ